MEHRLIVSYDISNDALRTKIHHFLKQYGINSQKSVFEMIVSEWDFRKIMDFLQSKVPLDEKDSVRIYELCPPCTRKISKLGEGLELNPLDFEII